MKKEVFEFLTRHQFLVIVIAMVGTAVSVVLASKGYAAWYLGILFWAMFFYATTLNQPVLPEKQSLSLLPIFVGLVWVVLVLTDNFNGVGAFFLGAMTIMAVLAIGSTLLKKRESRVKKEEKVPMWVPAEYKGMFWLGIFATLLTTSLTLFVDSRCWPAIVISVFAIGVGKWPNIKQALSDFYEGYKAVIRG